MAEKPTADISIVVSNFNNARYLGAFFESILHSSVLPRELIVVEDGSTDNSLEIITPYLVHPFIRLIRLDHNIGFANALNLGVQASTAKYIARVDPDDILLPDRLETQYRYMEENPGVTVLGGNVIYFHCETGNDIFRSNFLPHHRQILAAYRAGDHGIQHPTVLVRGDVFRKYAYQQENFPAEDYDVFARMIHDGHTFANLLQPVNRMRIHAGSVSAHLTFDTINKTFALRDKIFGMKSGLLRRRRYYYHILLYRKFLFSRSLLLKMVYITLSSLIYPRKVMLRIAEGRKS